MNEHSGERLKIRLNAVLWYMRRPKYYGDLLFRIKGRVLRAIGIRKDSRRDAAAWCAARSVDTSAAIARITGRPQEADVRTLFPEDFAEAEQRAATCPVKMGGAADLNLIYWLCEHAGATGVVETGVAYGWSSLAALLSLARRSGSRLLSTDMPYPGRNNDAYVGCVVPDRLRSMWRIIRHADREGLPVAVEELGMIDVCHYDSDKSYEGRMWAYPLLWNALRPGGILISDDVGDNVAFRDFTGRVAVDPVIIKFHNKFSGVLVKP